MANISTNMIVAQNEKRWQCLSGKLCAGGAGNSVEESRTLMQSTMTVCRVMPVGLSADAAAKWQFPITIAAQWQLKTGGHGGA